MEMANTTTTRPLAEGETRTLTTGRIVVRLQCVRPGAAYTVVTEQGLRRLDEEGWCYAYATQPEAEEAQAHAHNAFANWGTSAEIETETLRLQRLLRDHIDPQHDRRKLAATVAELATLATLVNRNTTAALLAA